MAINGISTQQVSGSPPNAGVSANGGSTYGFTPYHDHNGNKMVYLESRSASGVVSHMPLKFEQLESLCSRRGIAVPSLQYN